jgi:hypothetical protein
LLPGVAALITIRNGRAFGMAMLCLADCRCAALADRVSHL